MGIHKLIILVVLLMETYVTCACPNGCTCQDDDVNCEGAGLTEVPTDVPNQGTVNRFYLRNNKISQLGDGVFTNYSSLIQLDLGLNLISDISPGAFQGLDSMTNLKLDHNQIELLPDNVLETNFALESLNLSTNKLSEDVFRIFSSVAAPLLNSLDLSSNPILELPYLMLKSKEFLDFLIIGNASVSSIDANAFVGLKTLTYLDLKMNAITDLKRETFQHLTTINTIDLSDNPLECSCDTKKFQDWLKDASASDILDPDVTCSDPILGGSINIEKGDLEHLCYANATITTPAPTFPPPGDCSRDADLTLDVIDVTDEEAIIVWNVEEIEDDQQIQLECRVYQEVQFYQRTTTIAEGMAALEGLRGETNYVCCGLVYNCGVYACADFDTGVLPPPDCPQVGLVVGLTLAAVVLTALVVSGVVLLIYCIRARMEQSPYKGDSPYTPNSESNLVAMSTRTSGISTSTTVDPNKPPPPPNPRPPPLRHQASGTYYEIDNYEMIPADADTNGVVVKDAKALDPSRPDSVHNPGYPGFDVPGDVGGMANRRPKSSPSFAKHGVNPQDDAKRLTTGQYIHPDTTRKPRRFTKVPPANQQMAAATDASSAKSESDLSGLHPESNSELSNRAGKSKSNPNLLNHSHDNSSKTVADSSVMNSGRQSDPLPVNYENNASRDGSSVAGGDGVYLPPSDITLPPKKTETLRKAHEMGIGAFHNMHSEQV